MMKLKQLPLLCLSAAFVLGIAAGAMLPAFRGWWLGAVALLAVLLYLGENYLRPFIWFRKQWQKTLPLSLSWILLLFVLGGLRYAVVLPNFSVHDLAWYHGNGKAEIIGEIVRPPVVKDERIRMTVSVHSIELVSLGTHHPVLPVDGKIQVLAQGNASLVYGDVVRLYCEPETPTSFEGFDYGRYLASRGIYSVCNFAVVERLDTGEGNPLLRGIYSLRRAADERIQTALPPDEAALLSGILLGIEAHLSPTLEQAFQVTGTSHVIAISGANFTLLMGLVLVILRRWVGRRTQLPLMVGLIVLYTLFVGGNPAVLRAAFMGGLALMGRYIGRKGVGINSLGFAAAVLCLFNPYLLWDVGFQLSFMATLGLVCFSEPMLNGFKKVVGKWLDEDWVERLAGPVSEYFLMSLAAQLTTLPIIAYHFQQISLSSFPVNILILPVQPLIMGLGTGLLPLLLILPALGNTALYLLFPLLRYTIQIVQRSAQWRGAVLSVFTFSGVWLMGYYGLLLAPSIIKLWVPKMRRFLRPAYAVIGMGLLVASSWYAALVQPDSYIHVRLPDLDGAPVVLLQFPTGQAVLLDSVESGRELTHALEKSMSGYHLSQVLVRRDGLRVLDGLPAVMRRYQPDHLWVHHMAVRDGLIKRLAENQWPGIPEQMIIGQQFQVDEDMRLTVVYAAEEGAALLLECGMTKLLLPGGISFNVLMQIAPEIVNQSVGVVLSEEDLQAGMLGDWDIAPAQVILVSGTVQNCDGRCVSTGSHGWVELSMDGENLWLEVER